MGTVTKKIGEDLEIFNVRQVPAGYGRKKVYLEFYETFEEYYKQDAFPNLEEQYNILLEEDAFFDEEKNIWKDSNGNEYKEVFQSIEDWARIKYEGNEIEIEEDDYEICEVTIW